MSEIDYSRYIISKPIREAGPRYELKNRMNPSMTYLSRAQIPEAKQYIEFGWIWGIPEPNPHTPEHMHRLNEIVLHIGGDSQHPEDLGADIEFKVAGQPMILNTTSSLFVPRWLRHCPLTWKQYRHPHIQMTITLGAGDIREGWVDLNGEEAKKHLAEEPKDVDFEKNMVKKVEYGAIPNSGDKGSQPMILMSNHLVPGCNCYIEARWVNGQESSGSNTRVHTHNCDEIVLFIGGDWQRPEELGAELDFLMAGQRLKIDKTSAVLVPEGVKHGVSPAKKFLNPFLELSIMTGDALRS